MFRFLRMIALSMVCLPVGGALAQPGPGPEVVCAIEVFTKSCQSEYGIRPAQSRFCTGTCEANICPEPKQVQISASANEWTETHQQYRDAMVGETGVEIVQRSSVLCYSTADCDCVPDAEGDGDCFADINSVSKFWVERWLESDQCDGESLG